MVQLIRSREPEPIGSGIDDHSGMSDDSESQIAKSEPPLGDEEISRRILTIRGQDDFMFLLTEEEYLNLRSQFVTSRLWGGRRYLPNVFTEQGVVMLSSILNSKQAIQVNIAIMRAFVLLRRMLLSHEDLARKVDALERKYDAQFRVVFDAIRALMEPPKPLRRRIGF